MKLWKIVVLGLIAAAVVQVVLFQLSDRYVLSSKVDGLTCSEAIDESLERAAEICTQLLVSFEAAEEDVSNGIAISVNYWLKRAFFLVLSDRDDCEKLRDLELFSTRIEPSTLAGSVNGNVITEVMRRLRASATTASCP